MSDKSESPAGVGILSLFTVLLVLTLAVFTALTLSTARADLALSETGAATVSAWYAADDLANRLAADYIAAWPERAPRPAPEDCRSALSSLYPEAEALRVTAEGDGLRLSCALPVGET